jgi:ribonucleoside-diphosphate reductase beta chain
MSLFKERIPYKPFEYPIYYTEGWLKQAQAFWLHTEIPMSGDVKDWNEKLTLPEKNLVGNILLGFAQTECEDFEAFLHEPATSERFDNLVAYDGNDPVGIGRSLAIFSAFAEGVSLYSAFAVLYSFQLRNLLKGVGQQMKWSVRDESLHSKMGCQLFRHMCEEIPTLKEDCKEDIYKAAKIMVDLEEKYIDKMFEMGDIENLKANDLKQFIRKRTNEKLMELGYTDKRRLFSFDRASADVLDWFYHLTGGHTHTDFFAIRPTDYSKANEGEDFEDIW